MKPPHFTINDHGVPCLDGVPLPFVLRYDLNAPGPMDGFPELTVTLCVTTKVLPPKSPPPEGPSSRIITDSSGRL